MQITVNNKRILTVKGGKSLLATLADEKIFLPTACGGRGMCGLCRLKVLTGGGNLTYAEQRKLKDDEKKTNIRLACQITVSGDLNIEIPDKLLAVGEYKCKCTDIQDIASNVRQLRLELIEPRTIDYIPGQYVQALVPAYAKSGQEVSRAYSISSDPADKNAIELIARRTPGGISSTYFFEYLKVGDEVKFSGPYGKFILSQTQSPMVFVAGSSGMAPIKCMLHYMKNIGSKRKAIYYFGANKVNELILPELMRQFEKDLPNFRFVPVIANQQEKWDGQRGLVTEAIERNFKNAELYEAYICGNPGMVDAAIKTLKELGISDNKIFYDKLTTNNQ
ncbi:MAG: FAD-binding oxidoreductase [Phycisphaerae bacterium]